MTTRSRALGVTAGLLVACAIVGGLCGLLVLTPTLIQRVLRPSPDDGFITLMELAPWAFACGATLGGIIGPTLALSLLRQVPLWRVLLEPALGTVIGSAVGWTLARNPVLPGIPSLLLGALAGTLIAVWRLRRAIRR